MAALTNLACVRPLRRVSAHFRRSWTHADSCRGISVSALKLVVQQPITTASANVSPWRLFGAVCLQRLPVISQKLNPIEEEFAELTGQMDLENSLYSDHEIRLQEEAERMSRKKADYDSDDEDSVGQDIITAEDLEDSWEQRLKQVQPFLVFKETDAAHMSSADRCLKDSLTLLAKQRVGNEDLWLMPQVQWKTGETLRQTAERALASLPGADIKVTFLGNAPCGVYKYKFPKDIQTESCIGAKVFFFKALLSHRTSAPCQEGAVMWLRNSELPNYLRPTYLKQVKRFLLNM